jgi:hypothetical protein
MRFLLALALLAFAAPALADPCQGVQTPLCTIDHTLGAFVTFPAGATSCVVTDGAGWSTTVSGVGGQKVAFVVPTATGPSDVNRTVNATCKDAFGQTGAATRYAGTFPKPAAPAAPLVSGN